jgi:hypothetical protein
LPAIEVTNLRKIFRSKRKAAGMSGSMRALVRPEYSSVEAVRGLTFQMEPGELLGFIGPNGARQIDHNQDPDGHPASNRGRGQGMGWRSSRWVIMV